MLISSRHLLRREKGTLFSLYLLLAAKANFPKRLLPTSDFFFPLLKSSSKSSSSSSDPLVTWIEVKYVVLDTRTSVLKKLIGLSERGLRLLLVFWWCFRGCCKRGWTPKRGGWVVSETRCEQVFGMSNSTWWEAWKLFWTLSTTFVENRNVPKCKIVRKYTLLFSTLQKGKRLNRIDKMTISDVLNKAKLISRKIWVAENLENFGTTAQISKPTPFF